MKIALVGMAATTRDNAPYDDSSWEIWGLNEAYTLMPRFTRWFQIHPAWDFYRAWNFNDPIHPAWLRNEKWTTTLREVALRSKVWKKEQIGKIGEAIRTEDFPIYCIMEREEIPGSVEYPFAEVIESYGVNQDNMKYFTNSFGYMMALALMEEPEEIACYGWEMASGTEYEWQKSNAEFWLGVAHGEAKHTGMKINVDSENLLKAPLYAYEKIPGLTKMHLEVKLGAAQKDYRECLTKLLGFMHQQLQAERQLASQYSDKKRRDLGLKTLGLGEAIKNEFGRLKFLEGIMWTINGQLKDLSAIPASAPPASYCDIEGIMRITGEETITELEEKLKLTEEILCLH